MSTRYLILLCKLYQSGKSLVSLVEDDRILFRRFSRVQQLNLHLWSFPPGNGFRWRDIFACSLLPIRDHGCCPDQYENTKSLCHRFLLLMTCKRCAKYLSARSAMQATLQFTARQGSVIFSWRRVGQLAGMALGNSDRMSRGLTDCPHLDT